MAPHPNGGGPGTDHPAATDPYPAAVPSPVARNPDIGGAWSARDDLDPRGGWGGRSHNDCLRRPGDGLRRRRLHGHGSRGRSRSLPVGRCRGGRGSRRGSVGSLNRHRLGLVSDRRGIRLLDHVGRLNVVHGHISDLRLRTASDQSRDTRERGARGPNFSVHRIKVVHIQPVGR